MTQQAPHIWVPRVKILEPRRELVAPGIGVAGRFKLIAGKRDGRTRIVADWFPNLILNSGLDALGANRITGSSANQIGNMAFCHVGSGTNAPANGQTALQTFVAETGTMQAVTRGAESEAPFYGWLRRTFRFGEGAAEGNLAEVGIGPRLGDGSLFSRARILDGEGNPTTITILSDEFLDVVYEFRIYPPADDVLDTIDLGGSDLIFDTTIRALLVNDGDFWGIGSLTTTGISTIFRGAHLYPWGTVSEHYASDAALPANTASLPTNISTNRLTAFDLAAYTGGSHQRDMTMTWGLNNANIVGGVRSTYFRMGDNDQNSATNAAGLGGLYGIEFDPLIPKTDERILDLVLRTTWARKAL